MKCIGHMPQAAHQHAFNSAANSLSDCASVGPNVNTKTEHEGRWLPSLGGYNVFPAFFNPVLNPPEACSTNAQLFYERFRYTSLCP